MKSFAESVPIMVVPGGYARRIEDTVQIHVNTILAALDTPEKFPDKSDSASV